MRSLTLTVIAVLSMAVAGCDDDRADDAGGVTASEGSSPTDPASTQTPTRPSTTQPTPTQPSTTSAQPQGPAPDLAQLPGGADPLVVADGSAHPDACSVLTEEMVLTVLPGTGEGGQFSKPRASENANGTAYICQYAGAAPDGANLAFIGLAFSPQAAKLSPRDARAHFDERRDEASSGEEFIDFGGRLGAGTQAYYDGFFLEVSVRGQVFRVDAGSAQPDQDDLALWRVNVMVPIAQNVAARVR